METTMIVGIRLSDLFTKERLEKDSDFAELDESAKVPQDILRYFELDDYYLGDNEEDYIGKVVDNVYGEFHIEEIQWIFEFVKRQLVKRNIDISPKLYRVSSQVE